MKSMDLLVVLSSDDPEPFHELEGPKAAVHSPIARAIEQPYESSSPQAKNMPFSSSPVLYPATSSPAPILQKSKRKLFQTFSPHDNAAKKPRILGGFEVEATEDGEIPGPVAQSATEEHRPEFAVEEPRSQSRAASPDLPPLPVLFTSRLTPKNVQLQTSSGVRLNIARRTPTASKSYEQIIAQRSTSGSGRARTAYYGIDIHKLMDEAKVQKELDEAAIQLREEKAQQARNSSQYVTEKASLSTRDRRPAQLWTEKYRAKRFTDLVGDERTHRSVLRWLKSWDSTVFPGMTKQKTTRTFENHDQESQKKVLLLTGPPGLGKTTLAHVCAKQAGYEVLEINASDDRSRDVVRGQIKDVLGTETVRGIQEQGKARRVGKPVCVVLDEVDGVVSGSGGAGGEGGFMKALTDLVLLDQRNSNAKPNGNQKKKGDKFRQMRPLIMICNDVYAPSLRPLRQSGLAEIIHVRKPALDKVVSRLKTVFEKEHIQCDSDAVRRLCEDSWGLGTKKQNSIGSRGAGEGDIRGILVQGEWVAHKLRASGSGEARLTRKWLETHLGESGASQKGLGRGGIREVVERVFLEGAGMPNLPTKMSAEDTRLVNESRLNPIGVADLRKRAAITSLREMINTCGEHDRLMTELFSTYPTHDFQDDNFLSKPNASYEWLHFHDRLSTRIHSGQEWELNAYLSTGACGFHNLFAALDKGARAWNDEKQASDEVDENMHPFSGLKADFTAYEAEKANHTVLTEMQSNFSAPLLRLFSSVDTIATELVPNVGRMLAPEIKPVVVGGAGLTTASVRKESEKLCVSNAARVMHGLGIEFEKIRIEHEGGGAHSNGGYALRMEPPLDTLTTYHFSKASSSDNNKMSTSTPATAPAPVRYAIRQVLAQELAKEKALQASFARQARMSSNTTTTTTSSSTKTSSHPIQSSASPIFEDENEANKENHPNQRMSAKDLIASKSKQFSAAIDKISPIGNAPPVKKDFFGRPILQPSTSQANMTAAALKHSRHARTQSRTANGGSESDQNGSVGTISGQRTWVSFHEGYSNAVRKYISLSEFMDGF